MSGKAEQLQKRKRRRTAAQRGGDEGMADDGRQKAAFHSDGSDSETSEDEESAPSLPAPRRPVPPSPSALPSPVPSPSSESSSLPRSTVTVAVAGSIIANAQSAELRSYLAGQLARALTVFCVDRVVVFRDSPTEVREGDGVEGEWRGAHRGGDPTVFLARLLQFLECPQYLRKFLFPVHADLRYAGLLNPLDAPHHVRATEFSEWREGVVVKRPAGGGGGGGGRGGKGSGSWANVGLLHDVQLDRTLPPLTRVTVHMSADHTQPTQPLSRLQGRVVSPERPREAGRYWGYEVDVRPSFSDVFSSCHWTEDGAYDLTVGTSERGQCVQGERGEVAFELPPHRHLLVVFGGLQGLEECCASDERIAATSVDSLFDLYLNTCAAQGSRTIRTEEAILISLSLLRPHILRNQTSRSGETRKATSKQRHNS